MKAHLLATAAAMALLPTGVIFAMAGVSEEAINALKEQHSEVLAASQALIEAADQEGRDLTDEELEIIDENKVKAEKLTRQIAAREAVAIPAGAGRRTAAEPKNAGNQPAGGGALVTPRARDSARGGFKNFGEFAMAVRNAGVGNTQHEGVQKLLAAATTYGNEGTGADGGFAVPPDFRTAIWQKVMSDENLLTRCDQLVTGSNSMTFPKDETTPWQTTGGIQAYWEGEAAAVTASKPALTMSTMRLQKLMALVPVSDELLDDAPGLESWLRSKAPSKMVSKINTAIIAGTGVGQPLGILNSPCTISVAKETSQVADTVLFANINKMYSRMYAPCRRNAVWLINQDIEPQLDAMAFDPAASSKVPVYLPTNGLSDSPFASLKGRPVVPVEACSTLGDKGDIIFADLTQYMALTKGTDIRVDVSMHLYFDQALQAFRFIFRVNGQPWWGSAITPQNGNSTRSCFVTLDDRA